MKVIIATSPETVTLRRQDGSHVHVTWDLLQAAARQEDKELRTIYAALLRDAQATEGARLEAARRAGVAKCSGHQPEHSKTVGYDHPVSFFPWNRDNENPSAHGGVTEVEVCRCGAVRQTNVNGSHVETGDWM